MNAILASRAAALLITTTLAAGPLAAQTTGQGPSPSTPPAATTAQTPQQMNHAPSGTSQKAAPHSRQAASKGESLQAMVDRRIAELHSRLHITAQQGSQWEQFAQVMRDNARAMDDIYRQRAEKVGAMSAVDNMRSFAQIEQQRAQEVQKLIPAFQTLYTALSEQQKKTADDLFRAWAERAQSRREAAVVR